MRTIENVLVAEQRGVQIYTFPVIATFLAALCRVERFGEDKNGVNRRLNEGHMQDIAVAMSSQGNPTLWLEPIIVDLRGGWEFKDGKIIGDDDAYFSVDDGQHRVAALQSGLLTETEVAALTFNVVATIDLAYEMRLRIFRMQAERRAIDPRLDLAQRHRLGDWNDARDGEAYQVILQLASDTTSPLRNRIQLTEGNHRPRENSGSEVDPINARGLYQTIRSLMGRTSPLHTMLPSKRAEIITATIRTASEVWPNAWNSTRHVLTTARGINAVLRLFISGMNFARVVGEDISPASIRKALLLAKSFDWSTSKAKNCTMTQIMERLDQAILRSTQNRERRMADAPTAPPSTVPDQPQS